MQGSNLWRACFRRGHDMRELWIRERRPVRVLSARGLILCFRPSICAHVISYRLDRKQPVSRSLPWFFGVCTEKNPVRTGTILNMDDTLDVEGIVFLITLKHKTIICKSSHELRRLFLTTSGRQRVCRPRYISRTSAHANYDHWNKRTRIGLRSQSPIQSSLIRRAKADSRFTSVFRLKCPSRAMGNAADT